MKTEKKRILIVDDDIGITRLLKLNLEQTGDYIVRVEGAATGALAAAEHFHPDLILLDVMMPGLDGGELAGHFLASPQFKNVPIAFFTAAARKEEVVSGGGRIGGLPFLAKPAELSAVIAFLNQHLGTSPRTSPPTP